MKQHHLADDTYTVDITEDQSIKLVLAGKIYVCEGKHDGQGDDDVIYHVEDQWKLDLSKIESIIVRK